MELKQSETRIELARKCLAMISRIAARGAGSENPEQVGYDLGELSQVLFERSGSKERLFEPVSANQIAGLGKLLDELAFVDTCVPEPAASDLVKHPWRGAWN